MPDAGDPDRNETIARLNDRCRMGGDRTARHVITRACLAEFAGGSTDEGLFAQAMLMANVRAHVFEGSAATLRDSGDFVFRGTTVYFKIDTYDLKLEYGSEDPADPSVTTRVMTIMLAQDL